ncbi:unnamed protein product [Nesidiocoris tenuis]|uniref:Uncharacterized protein n=1 Tax=Nesidiocoris tenuis TaxID=355587 RepID=A0A6H5H9R7_9HEMI|nr:unnamed protein product [Nesidiocoris tenuis]
MAWYDGVRRRGQGIGRLRCSLVTYLVPVRKPHCPRSAAGATESPMAELAERQRQGDPLGGDPAQQVPRQSPLQRSALDYCAPPFEQSHRSGNSVRTPANFRAALNK